MQVLKTSAAANKDELTRSGGSTAELPPQGSASFTDQEEKHGIGPFIQAHHVPHISQDEC